MRQEQAIEHICARTLAARKSAGRVLVALAGPPGAGKSTLASNLIAALRNKVGSRAAALVPMDGFHLDNAELREKGLFSAKGAPETFDVAGFRALVAAIRDDRGDLAYPLFDRAQDKTLPGAATLPKEVRIVVFEGNYLLLQQGDWAALGRMFDVTALLTVPLPELRKRLITRWLEHGLTAPDAQARADGNDMINARTVLEGSALPDLRLSTQDDGQIVVETVKQGVSRTG